MFSSNCFADLIARQRICEGAAAILMQNDLRADETRRTRQHLSRLKNLLCPISCLDIPVQQLKNLKMKAQDAAKGM